MFLIPVTFDGEPFANTCALSPVIQIIVFSLIMLKSVRVCILKQIWISIPVNRGLCHCATLEFKDKFLIVLCRQPKSY